MRGINISNTENIFRKSYISTNTSKVIQNSIILKWKKLENFIICLSTNIISFTIGIYYVRKYKKENYKPEYGIKRDSNLEYIKMGSKYYHTIGHMH